MVHGNTDASPQTVLGETHNGKKFIFLRDLQNLPEVKTFRYHVRSGYIFVKQRVSYHLSLDLKTPGAIPLFSRVHASRASATTSDVKPAGVLQPLLISSDDAFTVSWCTTNCFPQVKTCDLPSPDPRPQVSVLAYF